MFLKICLLILERGRERETSIGCLPYVPHWRFEPETFLYTDDPSTNWAPPARAQKVYVWSLVGKLMWKCENTVFWSVVGWIWRWLAFLVDVKLVDMKVPLYLRKKIQRIDRPAQFKVVLFKDYLLNEFRLIVRSKCYLYLTTRMYYCMTIPISRFPGPKRCYVLKIIRVWV